MKLTNLLKFGQYYKLNLQTIPNNTICIRVKGTFFCFTFFVRCGHEEKGSCKNNDISYESWIKQNKQMMKTSIKMDNLEEFYKEWESPVLTLKKHIHQKIDFNLLNT